MREAKHDEEEEEEEEDIKQWFVDCQKQDKLDNFDNHGKLDRRSCRRMRGNTSSRRWPSARTAREEGDF